jgi:hypothetical protein
MSKVRKGRNIDSALCKKGFSRDEDGDHICYVLHGSSIRTKISHGMMGQDIGRELLAVMARQLRWSSAQFLELIDCSLNEADYRLVLRKRGLIS